VQWTDEADQLLIKVWDAGGRIADVVTALIAAGYVANRNAVIGRKNRLPRDSFRRPSRPPPKRVILRPKHESAANKGPVTHNRGVEYFKNEIGCRAILDQRSGKWNLPMVCGMPRGPDSPYCTAHSLTYFTPDSRSPTHFVARSLYYSRR